MGQRVSNEIKEERGWGSGEVGGWRGSSASGGGRRQTDGESQAEIERDSDGGDRVGET